jgi:acetylglutamate kinase
MRLQRTDGVAVNGPLILKFGGELLETPEQRSRISAVVAAIAAHRPVVIVHGGGRAIDAELDRRGIAPKKVDGLRITDAPTLDVVVSVLGGSANTELVAALVGQGVTAVGLTGVDAGFGRAVRTSAYRSTSGTVVDLGFVGDPAGVEATLIELLLVHGYVPVIASLGLDEGPVAAAIDSPRILNVNADVMACRIAAALSPCELVIAGTTPGVLDEYGESIPMLDAAGIDAIIASGTATAGMVAKLSACRGALLEGASSVRIVDGRLFDSDHGVDDAPGTTLVLAPKTAGRSVA